MVRILGLLCLLAPGYAAAQGNIPAGDARQGRDLFRAQHCAACHSVDGQGGGFAADLSKRIGPDQRPGGMALLLWNYAPAMWALFEKRGLSVPEISEQDAADLFACFYSTRYFERPGDPDRGRKVFLLRHCVECHAPGSTADGAAKLVSAWKAAGDPVALAEAAWNHAPKMHEAFARRRAEWPQLTSQELTDLAAYVRDVADSRKRMAEFPPASSLTGEKLFRARNCASCHTGPRAHAGRYSGRTLVDFASAMWNHAPQMAAKTSLGYGELRRIIDYLWTLQVVEPRGNPDRGRQLFAKRNCPACHGNSLEGAPALARYRGRMHPFALIGALFRHGAGMTKRYREKTMPWPRLAAVELADLLAYLNGPGGPSAPSHTHR